MAVAVVTKMATEANRQRVIAAFALTAAVVQGNGSEENTPRIRSPLGMGEAELRAFRRHYRMSLRQYEALKRQVRGYTSRCK